MGSLGEITLVVAIKYLGFGFVIDAILDVFGKRRAARTTKQL